MADRTSERTTKIWRDGQLVAWNDATDRAMSHVVHDGSNVFEGRSDLLPLFFACPAAERTPVRPVDRVPAGEGTPRSVTRAARADSPGIARGQTADPHAWVLPVPAPAGLPR